MNTRFRQAAALPSKFSPERAIASSSKLTATATGIMTLLTKARPAAPSTQAPAKKTFVTAANSTPPAAPKKPVTRNTATTAATIAAPAKTPPARVDSSSSDEDFVTVAARKRAPKPKPAKKTTTPVKNSYAALSDSEGHPSDSTTSSEEEVATPRKYKIPPLFFEPDLDHEDVTDALDSITVDHSYVLKPKGKGYRLVVKTPADYRAVTDALIADQIEFHTFPVEKPRTQRFIIRGLPLSASTAKIAAELKSLGFETTAVVQLGRNSGSEKIIYPLFAVTMAIPPGKAARNVSTITRLLRCAVKTEDPRSQRGPAQCHRCQRVGHATAFCHQAPRCVRCAGNHLLDDCPEPRGTDHPKCCNCVDGAHPASYRGCVYLKKAKVAQRATPTAATTKNNGWEKQPRIPIPPVTSKAENTTSGFSYAEATAGAMKPTTETNTPELTAILSTLMEIVQQTNKQLEMVASLVESLVNTNNASKR